MNNKYYRVKKDTFLWKEGAILKSSAPSTNRQLAGYSPIEDIWDATPTVKTVYISGDTVEHPDNAEWFERVYPDTLVGSIFKTKDQLIEMYKESFK